MPALIHTCYRITDIDRSVDFYNALGFEEVGRFQLPDGATNVFMGLPDDGARLELTYNPGVESYDIGTGYGHIAVTAGDLDGTLQALPARASSPSVRPTRCARAATACASCAIPTATELRSSRRRRHEPRGRERSRLSLMMFCTSEHYDSPGSFPARARMASTRTDASSCS